MRFRKRYRVELGIEDPDAWSSFVDRLRTRQYLLYLKHLAEIDAQVSGGVTARTVEDSLVVDAIR